MKVDYIIVGLGLAGLSFAEQLREHQRSFVVFEDNSQQSSLVAGGVYNPVILKRFTPVWEARNQLDVSLPVYERLEKELNEKFDYKFQIQKVFKNIEDQNNWFSACDKPLLTEFMNPNISNEKVQGIIGNHGFGEVYEAGRIDTATLISTYRNLLKEQNCLQKFSFKHQKLKINESFIQYQGITANRIVFCEGYGMTDNPWFNYLPLDEVKGETITIHAPDLKVDFLVKSSVFVLPLGDDMYKVGATFNHADKTSLPTKEGREELVEKLKKTISIPYTIVDQAAGIRPAVKDRRPLVGQHETHRNLYILNGLGTRGVMIGPWAAKQLFNSIENDGEIHPMMNITRFS